MHGLSARHPLLFTVGPGGCLPDQGIGFLGAALPADCPRLFAADIAVCAAQSATILVAQPGSDGEFGWGRVRRQARRRESRSNSGHAGRSCPRSLLPASKNLHNCRSYDRRSSYSLTMHLPSSCPITWSRSVIHPTVKSLASSNMEWRVCRNPWGNREGRSDIPYREVPPVRASNERITINRPCSARSTTLWAQLNRRNPELGRS